MPGSRGVGSGQKHTWKTSLTDTPTTDEEGVGQIREEHGPQGFRRFVWVKNVEATGCSAGDVLMYGGKYGGITISVINGSNSALTVIAGGGNVSFVTATILCDAKDNDFVDDWVILNSTVVAGNAPELECRKIRSNTSNRFFLATDFSVAASVLDGFFIYRPYAVVNATTASSGSRIAGVAMADMSADEFGWVQTKGVHFAVTVDTDVQDLNGPCVIGLGGNEVSSNLTADDMSLQQIPGQVIGHFIASVNSTLVALRAPVFLDIG